MTPAIEQTLEGLKPTKRLSVMDLVAQAGIDIAPWAKKLDGTPVKNPRANPHFCYNWAFGSEAEGFVLCVWHSTLKEVEVPGGVAVGYQENLRELALDLDRIAIDRGRPSDERNRARDQASRGRAFDSAIQRSFRLGHPIKLIMNEGDRRALEDLGEGKSTVKLRALDLADWYVHAYDQATGDNLIVREVRPSPSPSTDGPVSSPVTGEAAVDDTLDVPSDEVEGAGDAVDASDYVDQFSAPEIAGQREATVIVRERSAAIRARVLRRAGGMCELCGQSGFVTAAGSVYLETHHVIPLALDGADHETNMVALCPNDHRQAHYGEQREVLFEELQAIALGKHRAANS